MRFLLLAALTAVVAFGADEAWKKVTQLKSGGDVRVFKKGSRQPVVAKMDEADEDRLLVATKNEQLSIAKEDIERIDYRAPASSKGPTKRTRTTQSDPEPPRPGMPNVTPGPSTSSSTDYEWGSKGEFETVYRRTVAIPHKDASSAAGSKDEKK